jgi:hypothetical protein
VGRAVRAVISAGLAASVILSGTLVASPAIAVSSYPCGAESSATVGVLESLSLPATVPAGDAVRIQVSIRCEGDQQAVLAHMHLTRSTAKLGESMTKASCRITWIWPGLISEKNR